MTTILKAISGQDCLITVLFAIIAPVAVIGSRAGLTFRIGSELIPEHLLNGVARKDKRLMCFHNSIVVILLGGASLPFLLGVPVVVRVLHTDSGYGLHLRIQQRAAGATRRKFVPACLDLTEGVPHMGGWLSAEITAIFFANKWLRRMPSSRAVWLTDAGEAAVKRMAVLDG